jgi:hypothetical protein
MLVLEILNRIEPAYNMHFFWQKQTKYLLFFIYFGISDKYNRVHAKSKEFAKLTDHKKIRPKAHYNSQNYLFLNKSNEFFPPANTLQMTLLPCLYIEKCETFSTKLLKKGGLI